MAIPSGAPTAILRHFMRPMGGGGAVISTTLSSNVGILFNSRFISGDNQYQASSRQLSSLALALVRGTRTTSLLSGNNYSPRLVLANNVTSFISFANIMEPRANHVRRLHHRWFSDKSNNSSNNNDSPKDGNESDARSTQHNTWVQFQRSIAVSGFETGQTTKERTLGKKNRGGKIDRKRKEREAEAEALLRGEDVTQLKGGEFPALRYSDEETERLLTEAYAAIPPRAGKRGTLNLKRQKRRHFIKRQYHIKKKFERIAAHERRMAKRKRIYDQIKKYQAEAGDVRAKEEEYQNLVLRRWAEMNGHSKEVMVSK